MSTILLTGATGEVARGVLPFLEQDFELRLLALEPPGADRRRIQVNLLDWQALAPALSGVDAVLHLAIASGHIGTFEDEAFNDARFDINVKGTYHLFEAARRARVRRVVHVSSLMVVWGYGNGVCVPGDAEPRPVGTYALTKTLSERIAQYYAETASMEVITLRIAAPLDLADPGLHHQPVRPQQVPFPDLAQAFAKALTIPLAKYEIVTIVGDSSRRLWDLEPARRVLGYTPCYRLDDLGVTFAEPFVVRESV
jgi:uronate dehydrogenase